MNFKEWLFRDRDERTAHYYVLYSRRLKIEECDCEFGCILERAHATRNNWERKAIRLYARWCWERGELTYDDLMRIRHAAKLIARPYRYVMPVVVEKEPKVPAWLKPYILVLFYSGIRLSEAAYIAGKQFRIHDIGDGLGFIEVWFIRGKKRLYDVFAPIYVLEMIRDIKPRSYESLKSAFSKYGIKASTYRKYFYQRCTDVAPTYVCDFYQSRIATVSAAHYEALIAKAVEFYPIVMRALDDFSYAVLRARSLARLLDRLDDKKL